MIYSILADATIQYDAIVDRLLSVFNDYLVPSLMVIATCVFVVLAIINGIRYAKATQEEDKQKAKKNIIGMIVGAAVCVGGIWLMPLIFKFLVAAFGWTGVTSNPL